MTKVKKYGLELLNPVTPKKDKYLSYHQESTELIWAVTGGNTLYNDNHLMALREERRDGQKTVMTQIIPHSKV